MVEQKARNTKTRKTCAFLHKNLLNISYEKSIWEDEKFLEGKKTALLICKYHKLILEF